MKMQSTISPRILAFYYGWYGNPDFDKRYANWNHPIIDQSGRRFAGGDDIGSNFYPEAGCYSCNDPKTLDRQMQELRRARVGVICVSWWGKKTYTDQGINKLLEVADRHGIKVNFHIEPFPNRSAKTTREAIVYLLDTYGSHPAFHRGVEFGGKPVFFVYDSYLIPARDWAEILSSNGGNTLRGTRYDSTVIGLWVKEQDGSFMKEGHFDGFYTYFAADGFTWGSSTTNWLKLSEFAQKSGILFIPSVGPGYIDTRIRPWNSKTTRDRDNGAYYDRMFQAAIDSRAKIISITSYNEWHEGTQIEPAIPKQSNNFRYLDYGALSVDFYLTRTEYWIERFNQRMSGN